MGSTALSNRELEAAVSAYGPAVFSLAARLMQDPAAAEEVAQDVFLTLWKTTPRFESEEHRRRWLLRTTAHRATDRIRRVLSRPFLVADEALEEAPDTTPVPLPVHLEAQLDDLLRSLPDAMRAALVLRYGEESLSPEEVAAELGQPVATVKSNLQRGLALLRRKAAVQLKEYMRHA